MWSFLAKPLLLMKPCRTAKSLPDLGTVQRSIDGKPSNTIQIQRAPRQSIPSLCAERWNRRIEDRVVEAGAIESNPPGKWAVLKSSSDKSCVRRRLQ